MTQPHQERNVITAREVICSQCSRRQRPALGRRQGKHRASSCLVLMAVLLVSQVQVTIAHARFQNTYTSKARKTSKRQIFNHNNRPAWTRFGPWLQSVLPMKDKMGLSNILQRDPPVSVPLPDAASENEMEGSLSDTDEEDPWEDSRQKPLVPLLASAIDSILSDRQRLVSWSLKAAQYSLIWFLLKSIWGALKETVDELSQESLSGDPYFCSRSDLSRLVVFLEHPNSQGTSSTALLPRAALQLAQDLQLSGVPIRSPASSGRSSIESLFQDLTRSEASILQQCLWKPPPSVRQNPDDLWDAVLGLDEIKESILLTVAAASPASGMTGDALNTGPLHKTQQAYASLLSPGSKAASASTSQHHGILLYGEPGCGKSYFVQALASRFRLPCLVVTPSVLMRKYVGETNLQVRSLFSLLQNKLFPCIVVLDELDGLFRERHDNENDASRELKTEFLQWLSGLMTTSSRADNAGPRHPLIVVGATNRPLDVDSAILRRLPQRHYVGLPDFHTRCQLIQKMLQAIPLANDFQIEVLGQQTEGYTPSDIQQVLQTAARIGPIKEAIILGEQQQQENSSSNSEVRPLGTQDVLEALSRVGATPLSPNYRHALQQFANSNGASPQHSHQHHTHSGYPQGNPWGFHFMNMGTVQAPLDVSSPQDSTWDEQEEEVNNAAEEELFYDDDDDDLLEEEEFDEPEDLDEDEL